MVIAPATLPALSTMVEKIGVSLDGGVSKDELSPEVEEGADGLVASGGVVSSVVLETGSGISFGSDVGGGAGSGSGVGVGTGSGSGTGGRGSVIGEEVELPPPLETKQLPVVNSTSLP